MPRKINLNILIFELTDTCNQTCKFCYNHWKGNSEIEDSNEKLSYQQVKRVLREIYKQASVNSISFSGGEPMLMPKIHDLVFYARLHKSNISILTNGTLLNNDKIESFIDLGVRHIQIPILSANPDIHNALTQVKGSWQRAIAATTFILNKNPALFNAVLVLNKQNIAELEHTLMFYKKSGIRNVLVNRFNIGGLGRKYETELTLSHKELQDAFAMIDTFAYKYPVRFYSGVCTPICVLDPAAYRKIGFSFCNTDVSYRPITVNYKGDVRFCNHSPRVLGNVFEKSLTDILQNDTNKAYFSTIPTYCVSCKEFTRCGGGCRAASEQVYKTFAEVDPLLQL